LPLSWSSAPALRLIPPRPSRSLLSLISRRRLAIRLSSDGCSRVLGENFAGLAIDAELRLAVPRSDEGRGAGAGVAGAGAGAVGAVGPAARAAGSGTPVHLRFVVQPLQGPSGCGHLRLVGLPPPLPLPWLAPLPRPLIATRAAEMPALRRLVPQRVQRGGVRVPGVMASP
jgi:hypothetical protein